jgi:hypothetical protein
VLALLLVGVVLAACADSASDDAKERALIDAPAVGDLYAAELTYFSEADFEGQARVYGLMKVVDVDEGSVTVITENAASADEAVPIEEMDGPLEHIEFDPNEQIDIPHTRLLEAHGAGKILAVRRPGT